MDTKKRSYMIKMNTKPFLLKDLAVCRFSCRGEFVAKCAAANSTGMEAHQTFLNASVTCLHIQPTEVYRGLQRLGGGAGVQFEKQPVPVFPFLG